MSPRTREAGQEQPPAPFTHTRWQHAVRELFLMFGPAQTGLPPYATPEERAEWRRINAPLPSAPPREAQVPPGYRIRVYRDYAGIEHRSLVQDPPPGA